MKLYIVVDRIVYHYTIERYRLFILYKPVTSISITTNHDIEGSLGCQTCYELAYIARHATTHLC